MMASQPSKMAVATSEHSARVGAGESIMDSSIWVATMTGLPCRRHSSIISFWTMGTSSGGISTPKSPRATMIPSQTSTIARSCSGSTACGFSSFARSLAFDRPLMRSRSSSMSSGRCTNESAIQSTVTPWKPSIRNSRSSMSFGVIAEHGTTVSGRLKPFRDDSAASFFTTVSTKPTPVPVTSTRSLPSSIKIASPTVNAESTSGCGRLTRLSSPTASVSRSKRYAWPSVRCTLGTSSPNIPTRCFGPWRSARMPMGWSYFCSMSRTMRDASSLSSAPWLRFMRNTSVPARNSFSIISGDADAGPSVDTCLTPLRKRADATAGATASGASVAALSGGSAARSCRSAAARATSSVTATHDKDIRDILDVLLRAVGRCDRAKARVLALFNRCCVAVPKFLMLCERGVIKGARKQVCRWSELRTDTHSPNKSHCDTCD
mmetsp:Transcript_18656/g.57480  ORF Transcript_18656/g.57480 Transcript_18656/m.57480 type:complete len:435 (+) Transcript_18656:616-1920(+)